MNKASSIIHHPDAPTHQCVTATPSPHRTREGARKEQVEEGTVGMEVRVEGWYRETGRWNVVPVNPSGEDC